MRFSELLKFLADVFRNDNKKELMIYSTINSKRAFSIFTEKAPRVLIYVNDIPIRATYSINAILSQQSDRYEQASGLPKQT